jgi:CheY-like chemotaxis protein
MKTLPTSGRPRLLLVDDHQGILTALVRLLGPDCDVVGTVSDGLVAVEATTRLQPDVVVVDLNMPQMNGLEVCRQIRQTNPHVRVILLSAAVDQGIQERGLAIGAFAVIAKQKCIDDLLPAILGTV